MNEANESSSALFFFYSTIMLLYFVSTFLKIFPSITFKNFQENVKRTMSNAAM